MKNYSLWHLPLFLDFFIYFLGYDARISVTNLPHVLVYSPHFGISFIVKTNLLNELIEGLEAISSLKNLLIFISSLES